MRNKNQSSNLLSVYFFCIFVALFIVLIIQQFFYFAEDREEVQEEEVINNAEPESRSLDVQQPKTLTKFVVAEGDTFSGILEQAGSSKLESYQISQAVSKVFNLKKIRIGFALYFVYDTKVNTSSLEVVTMEISETQRVVIKKNEKLGYKAEIITIDLIKRITKNSIKITDGVMQAARKMHISDAALPRVMKAFSYDIDFQRDVRKGDKLEVIMHKLYTKEGKFVGYGDVLYASLELKKKKVEIYRFINKKKILEYYGPDGHSVKNQFLKTPISAARISSGFGMRKHPVHGYTRMHKGVDFAAPEGTPVLAAADGKIVIAGRKGGYGKYIKIDHTKEYSTAYAHLRNFANGISSKQFVKQGQVIGYVGTTGVSTGPHLHFELHKDGKQVNPNKMEAPSKIKLNREESKVFENSKKKIQKILTTLKNNQEINDII